MSNAICQEEYCELTLNKESSDRMTFSQKALLVGGYTLFGIAFGALLWYEAFLGIYIDPALLS
jgi:hypothetical protein